MEDDLYKILGVKKKASKQEIKNAYRDKAKKAHPDKGGDKEEFNKITRAYKILTDTKARLTYDVTGGVSTSDNEKLSKASAMCITSLENLLSELGDNILTEDIFLLLQKVFKKHIKDVNKDTTEMSRGKEILLSLQEAVTYKSKNGYPDVFGTFIEKRVQDLEYGILRNEEQLEICDVCLKIVAMYSMKTRPKKNTPPPYAEDGFAEFLRDIFIDKNSRKGFASFEGTYDPFSNEDNMRREHYK